jgi:hypothetical protein
MFVMSVRVQTRDIFCETIFDAYFESTCWRICFVTGVTRGVPIATRFIGVSQVLLVNCKVSIKVHGTVLDYVCFQDAAEAASKSCVEEQ